MHSSLPMPHAGPLDGRSATLPPNLLNASLAAMSLLTGRFGTDWQALKLSLLEKRCVMPSDASHRRGLPGDYPTVASIPMPRPLMELRAMQT